MNHVEAINAVYEQYGVEVDISHDACSDMMRITGTVDGYMYGYMMSRSDLDEHLVRTRLYTPYEVYTCLAKATLGWHRESMSKPQVEN